MRKILFQYPFLLFCAFLCYLSCSKAMERDEFKEYPQTPTPHSSWAAHEEQNLLSRRNSASKLTPSKQAPRPRSWSERKTSSQDILSAVQIIEYANMPEEQFQKKLTNQPHLTKQVILKIVQDPKNFTTLLEHSGWLAKITCDPHCALEVLQKDSYQKLIEKDEHCPSKLISVVFQAPLLYERLFSLPHISADQILKAWPEKDKKTEQVLWQLAKPIKSWMDGKKEKEIETQSWKALEVLAKCKHQKSISITHGLDKKIEGFLENYNELKKCCELPPYFSLFLELPGVDKGKFPFSKCTFSGETILFSQPHLALQLWEIAASSGNQKAISSLGRYHLHMQNFGIAKDYFLLVEDNSQILFNLGVVYESLGEKEKAVEFYKKENPLSLSGKYKLLNLYKFWKKEEDALTIRESIEKDFKEINNKKERQNNVLEAAIVAILLGDWQNSLELMDNSGSSIFEHKLNPSLATEHLMAAFVKSALKQKAPQRVFLPDEGVHLEKIKSWASQILKETTHNEKSSLESFCLNTPCIGSYSLRYLKEAEFSDMIKKFDEILLTSQNTLEIEK